MREIYNIRALMTQNALWANDRKFEASTGRLSSGKKIASAKDNPGGLAASRHLEAQIQAMKKAAASASDGVNIVQTVDGALTEVHEMLQKMEELAVRASTDTLQSTDRDYIQAELASLKSEVNRISKTTQFNGQNLVDGGFDRHGYVTLNDATVPGIGVTTCSEEMKAGTYKITGLDVKLAEGEGIEQRNQAFDDGARKLDYKNYDISALKVTLEVPGQDDTVVFKPGLKGTTVNIIGNQVKFSNNEGESLTLEINQAISAGDSLQVDLANGGPLRLQIGANEGQAVDVKIPPINMEALGIRFSDCSKRDWAGEALDDVRYAIDYVSRARTAIGAMQNRMENRQSALAVTQEDITGAISRITDADMAEEMTEYSSLQVMTQAGVSMLAQANQRPADVLQLLQ